MLKKIFILLLIVFLIIFIFLIFNLKKPKEIKASPGSGDNVWGWAWAGSPTSTPLEAGSGWISFNSINTGASPVDYGVNIDPLTFKFSGRAWLGGGEEGGNPGRVLGWLSFERSETGDPPSDDPCPPPDGSCIAKVGDVDPAICDFQGGAANGFLDTWCGGDNSTTSVGNYKQVFGWARFCGIPDGGSTVVCGGDGWDGWVKFSNFSPVVARRYGTTIDITGTPNKEFRGWAWGSDVVGWISFNCSNENWCSTSSYKVLTSFSINDPPYVEPGSPTTTGEEYCGNSPIGLINIQWKYMDNDGDPQAEYNLQVATDPAFNPADIILDYTASSPVPAGGLGTSAIRVVPAPVTPGQPEIPYPGSLATRYWRVRVRAQSGDPNWSNWGDVVSFVIPPHPPPQCDFIWVPLHPSVGEIVQFYDQSKAYGGATTTSWSWNFQHGNPPSSTIQNPTTTFTAIESAGNEISLQVCDDTPPAMGGPYCCTQTKKLTVTLPLPKWKEIKP